MYVIQIFIGRDWATLPKFYNSMVVACNESRRVERERGLSQFEVRVVKIKQR